MSYVQQAISQRVEVPPHVPADRVVEWDYIHPEGVEDDPHLAWLKLHEGPDLVWTPYNGGHWIATRADTMFDIMQDFETFSSREFNVPRRSPGTPLLVPNQLDPPHHGEVRQIALRPLSPKAVAPLEATIRKIMRERIASLAPQGGCEFVSAFSSTIPPELFLEHARLPKDRLVEMKQAVDTIAHSNDEAERSAARHKGAAYMEELLEQRRQRAELDDSLFDVIIQAEREGRLTRAESMGMALNIFNGGLETVASALSFIILFLARNPGHRQQLIDNPELGSDAVEEFLRRFGILNLARITTRRTVFRGMTIEEDEQVLLPLHLSGLDDRRFTDPLTVDFKRKRGAHFTFGAGPHRCLGSNLARPELRIFLEEWLRLIPDFEVDPNDKPIGTSGIAMGMSRVPLVWKTA